MRHLRILHVTPYAPEAWAYGGIPRLTGALVGGLVRRGHHVTICSTDARDSVSRLAPKGRRPSDRRPWRASSCGADLVVFPNLSNQLAYRHQLFWPVGFADYMQSHAREFDVAHLHACRNVPGLIAATPLRRAGIPYVMAPNGTALRLERQYVAKRIFDACWGNALLSGAAAIQAVSRAEQAQLRSLGIAPEAIRLIPNPIDVGEFDPPMTRGWLRQRFDLGNAPVVLFLGKLTPRKRVDILVRAVGQIRRDAQLVIAGNDMGAEGAIRSVVHALGLDRRTLFTGLLESRDRLHALADADVVVYPSSDEIFGLVPLEALLAGTPVIVSDDSGCGEVIRSTGGGLVARLGDVRELALAIDAVLDAPNRWRLEATCAAARVRAAYGTDAVSAQVDSMYQELVQRAS